MTSPCSEIAYLICLYFNILQMIFPNVLFFVNGKSIWLYGITVPHWTKSLVRIRLWLPRGFLEWEHKKCYRALFCVIQSMICIGFHESFTDRNDLNQRIQAHSTICAYMTSDEILSLYGILSTNQNYVSSQIYIYTFRSFFEVSYCRSIDTIWNIMQPGISNPTYF